MKKITIRKPEQCAMKIVDFFDAFLLSHDIFVTRDPNHPEFTLPEHYSQMIQDVFEIIKEYEAP